jgi:hypothetical protein
MQFLEQCFERPAAMTQAEFLLETDFRHGAIQLWEIEERIVAEPSGSAGRLQDYALDRPFGCVNDLTVAGSSQHAAISRLTPIFGNIDHPLKQDHVVPHIRIVEERTPGAPSSASTSRPESSAKTNSPEANCE